MTVTLKNTLLKNTIIRVLIPTDVQPSALELWLDANDSDTITRDVNNRVSLWEDKSDIGNDFAQGTLANQALYVSDGLNGKGAITFAVNDWFTAGGVRLFTKEHTIFIVGKHGYAINQWYFSKFVGGANGEFFIAAN